MIEMIPGLPENVLGFKAVGTVTAKDYETIIIPAVEKMFAEKGKVRFLYHLGDDYEGFEAAAAWDDTKLGFKHLTGWEKMALVTDVEWIRLALKAFRIIIPGHIRVFHKDELDEAKEWITT